MVLEQRAERYGRFRLALVGLACTAFSAWGLGNLLSCALVPADSEGLAPFLVVEPAATSSMTGIQTQPTVSTLGVLVDIQAGPGSDFVSLYVETGTLGIAGSGASASCTTMCVPVPAGDGFFQVEVVPTSMQARLSVQLVQLFDTATSATPTDATVGSPQLDSMAPTTASGEPSPNSTGCPPGIVEAERTIYVTTSALAPTDAATDGMSPSGDADDGDAPDGDTTTDSAVDEGGDADAE